MIISDDDGASISIEAFPRDGSSELSHGCFLQKWLRIRPHFEEKQFGLVKLLDEVWLYVLTFGINEFYSKSSRPCLPIPLLVLLL